MPIMHLIVVRALGLLLFAVSSFLTGVDRGKVGLEVFPLRLIF